MADFTVDFAGFDAVNAALVRIGNAAKFPKGTLEKASLIMKRESLFAFERQADPITGQPWKRSSAATFRSRVGGGGSGKTLTDTGDLRTDVATAAPILTPKTVSIGTTLPYGPVHQNGARIRPKRARSLAVPLTRDARRAKGARRWINQNQDLNPFFVKSGSGRRFIAYRDPSNGALRVAFQLLAFVDIPQRRFLGLGDKAVNDISTIVSNDLVKAFEGDLI